MAKEDNLTPWKPGQSGNPEGKKPGTRNRSTIVREILETIHASGVTNGEAATIAVLAKALDGDTTAWDKLMDSAYGKVTDKTELTGAEGKDLIPSWENMDETGKREIAKRLAFILSSAVKE